MKPRGRCPSPIQLERAFWSKDARVREHAELCPRCGAAWREIVALVRAGNEIPVPPDSPERLEEIRTALLSAERPVRERRLARRWLLVGPLAATAAITLVWWRSPARAPPARALTSVHGRVLSHDGARHFIAGVQPDEIIRLLDGTITVAVDPLRAGERLRVITGDAEVDARGTTFDVTARDDHLLAVRAIQGAVEVRFAGSAAERLTAGRTWRAPDAERAAAPPPAEPAAPAGAEPAARAPAPSRAARKTRSEDEPGAPTVPPPPHTEPNGRGASAGRSAAQQAFDDGWTEIRRGDFAAAAAAFERAASAGGDPRGVEDARYWHAVALARAGQPTRAIRAFEIFLEASPASVRAGEASAMLGWLLLGDGDREGAARRFRDARQDPSPDVRRSAAEGLDALRRAER